jgi:diacylglycerol kinase (CTP)
MQQPNVPESATSATESPELMTRGGPYQSSARRRSTRRPSTLPNLTHVQPQAYVDPIARVKRESIHWKRKVFHVIGIGTCALTYALTSVTWMEALAILGAVAVIFSSLDMARFYIPSLNQKVRKDFGPFMRDYELNSLSGSTWFFFAGLIAIAAFPKVAVALSFLYLAIGDPLASWVGLKWGRIRLPGGKSLEGSLTFFVVSAVAGLALLFFDASVAFGWSAVALVGITAAVAAFAEWLPIKGVDDNFIVPLLTSAAGAAVLLAIG